MGLLGMGGALLVTGIVVAVLFVLFVTLVVIGMLHPKREQEDEARMTSRESHLASVWGIQWVKDNRERQRQLGPWKPEEIPYPNRHSMGSQFDATNPAYSDLVKQHNDGVERAAKLREQQRVEGEREEEEQRVKDAYFLQRELEVQMEEKRAVWEKEFQERKKRQG